MKTKNADLGLDSCYFSEDSSGKWHDYQNVGKCGEQVNITIGFSVDDVIFKMGIIILASQSVLAVSFYKILCAKPEKKHGIDIYRWGRYQSIDATNVDLIDIASIDMQH